MTAPQAARDVCLDVLDAAEANDYGSGYGSPGVVYIAYPQAAKITDDLLAALAEAGYVVVRAEDAAPVVNQERVAEVLAGVTHDLQKRMEAGHIEDDANTQADALLAAGVFRDEAEVRKQVAEEIAQALDARYADNLKVAHGDMDIIPPDARAGVATGYQRSAQIAREIGGLS